MLGLLRRPWIVSQSGTAAKEPSADDLPPVLPALDKAKHRFNKG